MGAPEILVEKSGIPQSEKEKFHRQIASWAGEGLRVVGLAIKTGRQISAIKHGQIKDVRFLGLIGFADPVRAGVKESLALCRDAGISVKVVTGDYRLTAQAVMKQVGLPITDAQTQIVDGETLSHLSQSELEKRVDEIILFARVSPSQKLAVVEALKARGHVVGLLGDGVNDAPAIKRADVGIVVGEASDVARETADLVLLDSNFATIVAAVEEGRGIFINIQKVLRYILSDTLAEVILLFLGMLFGTPLPLTAAQILWINLVTDTFPTLALTVEPKEAHLLRRKPIASNLPLLNKSMIGFMLLASFSSGIIIFGLFVYLLRSNVSLEAARAVAFCAFGVKSLLYVFSLRHQRHFLWQKSPFTNRWLSAGVLVSFVIQIIGIYQPFLQGLLQTHPLGISEWGMVIGAGVLIVCCIESGKLVRKFIKSA